jgi:transcriptional regulator with XRE-family HTH domain
MAKVYSDTICGLFTWCRRSADMSVKDVADLMQTHEGVTVSYLVDFERGLLTPPLSLLSELFEVVGYKLEITAMPLEADDV